MATTLGEVLDELRNDNSLASSYERGDIDDLHKSLDEQIVNIIDAVDLPEEILPIRIPKSRITAVLACPRKAVEELGGDIDPFNSLRGAVADVTAVVAAMSPSKPLDLDEIMQGVAMIDAESDGVELWRSANRERRAELREYLVPLVERFQQSCSGVDARWVVRPQFTAQASFAGGRVVSTARFDMLLSQPNRSETSVIVEVKAGKSHSDHRADAFLYALLETLRTAVSPLAVVAAGTDEIPLQVERVTGGVLEAAARRLLAATAVVVDLAANPTEDPEEKPGRHCAICRVRKQCGSALVGPLKSSEEP
ncbi:MAG: hypothetical protein V3V01_19785 [Acidimicrobiales bacterium]